MKTEEIYCSLKILNFDEFRENDLVNKNILNFELFLSNGLNECVKKTFIQRAVFKSKSRGLPKNMRIFFFPLKDGFVVSKNSIESVFPLLGARLDLLKMGKSIFSA